jgi:hypothetical protein
VEELHIKLVVLHDQDGFSHPPFPSPVPSPMLAAVCEIRLLPRSGRQAGKLVFICYGKANGTR